MTYTITVEKNPWADDTTHYTYDGLDAIFAAWAAAGATANWDELYAGHITAGTYGLLMKEIAQGDTVYINTIVGVAGTAAPVGEAAHPVSNQPNAATIAAAYRTNKYALFTGPAGTLTLTQAWQAALVMGAGHDVSTIILNGQVVTASTFVNLLLTGNAAGSDFNAIGCVLSGVTNFIGHGYTDCLLLGTLVPGADDISFKDCTAWDTVTFNMGNLGAGDTCEFQNVTGNVTITNLTAGTVDVTIQGGTLTLAASCTGGTINIYNNCNLVDGSAGTVVNDYRAVAIAVGGVWDIGGALHVAPGTFGLILQEIGNVAAAGAPAAGSYFDMLMTGGYDWDALYAAHTAAGSFGELVEEMDFGDAVYIDTVGGAAGVAFPLGTPTYPVDNLANAITIATARGLRKFRICAPCTVTLAAPLAAAWIFEGNGYDTIVDFNGNTPNGSTFINCRLTGESNDGNVMAIDCYLDAVRVCGYFKNIILTGTWRPNGDTIIFGMKVNQLWAGGVGSTPSMNLNDITSDEILNITGFEGYVELENMTVVDSKVNFWTLPDSFISVGASCTQGTFEIYGDGELVNNGTSTVNDFRSRRFTEANAVTGETTLADSDNGGMEANTEYWWFEVLISATHVKVYEYNFTHAAPGEATDRVEIASFSANAAAWTAKSVILDINKAVSGLFPLLPGQASARIYLEWYEPTNAAWKLMSPVILRNQTDTLSSTPPYETDLGETITFDLPDTASRIVGKLWVDDAITSQVDLPFEIVIKEAGSLNPPQ